MVIVYFTNPAIKNDSTLLIN